MTTGRINQVARRYPRGCGARAFREKGRKSRPRRPSDIANLAVALARAHALCAAWKTGRPRGFRGPLAPPVPRRGGAQGDAQGQARRLVLLWPQAVRCFALRANQAQESRFVRQGARCESDTPRRGANERRWHALCARQVTLLTPRHASTRISNDPLLSEPPHIPSQAYQSSVAPLRLCELPAMRGLAAAGRRRGRRPCSRDTCARRCDPRRVRTRPEEGTAPGSRCVVLRTLACLPNGERSNPFAPRTDARRWPPLRTEAGGALGTSGAARCSGRWREPAPHTTHRDCAPAAHCGTLTCKAALSIEAPLALPRAHPPDCRFGRPHRGREACEVRDAFRMGGSDAALRPRHRAPPHLSSDCWGRRRRGLLMVRS